MPFYSGSLAVVQLSSLFNPVMNFAEFELLLISDRSNVALLGNASQSSVYNGNPVCGEFGYCGACSDIAAAAIDGNYCTYQAEGESDPLPWWKVTLATPLLASEIFSIDIFPRASGWSSRINSADLTGFDTSGAVLFSLALPANAAGGWPAVITEVAAALRKLIAA